MPDYAPPASIARARAAGANVRLTPGMPEAFLLLDELVAAGLTPVHPFDDPAVVAGQGTVGPEFVQDPTDLTDVLVSVGGGGLIAGVATAFRWLAPEVRIWGAETEGATAMFEALTAAKPVSTAPTSIVSTLSAPHVSALTLEHTVELVEEVIVVSDADAVRGSLTLAEEAKVWAEPAAGCLIPAAQAGHPTGGTGCPARHDRLRRQRDHRGDERLDRAVRYRLPNDAMISIQRFHMCSTDFAPPSYNIRLGTDSGR